MEGPCFDPTCPCCTAWSDLNDRLRDQLVDPDEQRRITALKISATRYGGGGASDRTIVKEAQRFTQYLKDGT